MTIQCVVRDDHGAVLTSTLPVARWEYEPQKDITAYEAACALAFLFAHRGRGFPDWSWLTDRCGETVMRHFRKTA